MVFEFIFSTQKYFNSIRQFAYFLKYHASKKNLSFAEHFSVSNNGNFYSFYLQTTPEIALEFAQTIGARLPMSLDFNFVELKAHQDLGLKWQSNSKIPASFDKFPDASQMSQILDKNSADFCNLKAWVKNIAFMGKTIPKTKINPAFLQDMFEKLASRLKNHETLCIKTSRGLKEFSFVKKSQNIMFWDLSNVLTYTRIETAQSHLLASYEKPRTKLCPKEVFASLLLQDGGVASNFEFNALLPYDLILSILGLFALELDMGYVFLQDGDSGDKTCDLSYDHFPIPKEREVVMSRDGLWLDTRISQHSKSIFDVIAKHFKDSKIPTSESPSTPPSTPKSPKTPPKNHQKLIVFLSKKNPTCFWIKEGSSYKTALPIHFEANPKHIVAAIENHYKDGKKLLKNFTSHFELITQRLNALPKESMMSSNMMDIFSTAGFILGYREDFCLGSEEILHHAKKFVRDKGPRIDFKLRRKDDENNENAGLELDFPKIIRSSMSFRIAGLDEATLSYGFIDSMAEFLGNFVRDVSVNFSIKSVLLCGDMLGEKIFLDKILHYLPKNIDLTLPKEGYIDYS
ncbi:hypothetical protein [Helicobacter sp. 11S02596-1]|uniref:hypothetical protein n=1 Tax=Helicobacter sp. 11S02596-1 TaxID=1476194 RepID=UPI000BA6FBAF|nr:hypothetical protein [Helicobacter sp. 11S02596-1]PAF41766.1 hypothetical protein BJI48_07885 [Helicobacter sp. 11S02596-1]